MQLKKLREILDAIEKKSPDGENADVMMFYDNSHGGGSWEFANPENIIQFKDDDTFYLGADFDFFGEDPYDSKIKACYTSVNDALKNKWEDKYTSPYCSNDADEDDDFEYKEEDDEYYLSMIPDEQTEEEKAAVEELCKGSTDGVLKFYQDIAKLTGKEPPTDYSQCWISTDEFHKRLRELERNAKS